MQKYQNNVTDKHGNAVAGAAVTVTLLSGGTPILYSDNGITPLGQPLVTDVLGYFYFYAADGRYSLSIATGSGAPTIITDIILEDPADTLVSVRGYINGPIDGISDNTAGIQAAINANPGRTIYFPAGTYIASTLTIPASMNFEGEGPGSVLKQKASTNGFFIQTISNGIQVTFSDMTLDQNNVGQTSHLGSFLFNTVADGIASSPHAVEFYRVIFKDFCEGAIRMVGDRLSTTREILKVIACKFRGGTESESGIYDTFTIYAADAIEITVTGCDFDHGLTLSKQGLPAITIQGVITPSAEYTKITIRGNRFNGYGRYTASSGIGVIDFYAWGEQIDISGNKFTNSYVTPIRGKTNARNVIIQDNILTNFLASTLANGNSGISIVQATLAPTIGRYIIADNIIDSPLYRGIEIVDGGGTPESLIISDNIIRSSTDVGISLNGCKGFAIVGNNIKLAGQQGITFSSCSGIGRIDGNIIDTSAITGIQQIGAMLTLDLQVHGNSINSSSICGITVEDVRVLSLQDNEVRDVILSGSQRGYRIGGSTGTAVGQLKNNLAIGTFASGQVTVIGAGFTTAIYEYGNSWNFQETYASAAPVAGTWARGDKVWNTLPAASGNIGFVCVTAGSPGTWKTFGTIAP